jgi:hypothetical protein
MKTGQNTYHLFNNKAPIEKQALLCLLKMSCLLTGRTQYLFVLLLQNDTLK